MKKKRKLVFVGAGFDVPGGIPTMLDFFSKAWSLFDDATGLGGLERDLPAFKNIKRAWDEWRKYANCPNDLEEFALRVESMNNEMLVGDLRFFIARTLDLTKERVVGFMHSSSIWKRVYRCFAKSCRWSL